MVSEREPNNNTIKDNEALGSTLITYKKKEKILEFSNI